MSLPTLSVLDLAAVGEGSSHSEALQNSIDLARTVERLGYHRHWVAEHHNMPGIASSAPAVLAASIAASTSTIRVGSGGVMLPNHTPLVVAEQFGMLEALHPGRIDLGIGRAPGTDSITAAALRRGVDPLSDEEFPDRLPSCSAFFTGVFPEGHPYAQIHAVPGRGDLPEVWLLGSCGYSAPARGPARDAVLVRPPLQPQQHGAGAEPLPRAFPALGFPRRALREGRRGDDRRRDRRAGALPLGSGSPLDGPPACGDAGPLPDARGGGGARVLRRRRSRASPTCPARPQSAAPRPWSRKLGELAERTQADELMLVTMVHGHEDRIRSYELIAEAAGI